MEWKKPMAMLEFFLIALWTANLAHTEGYFVTYALCGLVATVCLTDNYRHNWRLPTVARIFAVLTAAAFGAAVALANYPLFTLVRNPEEVSYSTNRILNLINAGFTVVGGYAAAWNVLRCAFHRFPMRTERWLPRREPWLVFAGSFLAIAAINLVCHFFVIYPGSLSLDSMDQIAQIRTGVYSNHHPFWHTMVIKLFLEIGYGIFGDINKAVSLYTIFQILVMAACFSYVLMTLYEAGVARSWIAVCFGLYAFLHYNIVMSCTMWKDVLFGGAVCAFLTAMFRILRDIGWNKVWNYIILALSGLGFCLWRSNGFLALVAAIPVFAVVLWKDHKKMLVVILAVVAAGWVMKGPVLSAMGVTDPDLVESLSIPVQQVARVIADGCELTAEEAELIDRVVDMEEVPQLYRPHISDNIKNEIRSKDNAYFEEHVGQYFDLWLKLLMKYPAEYVEAWVDQTKGYWGGGFENWMYGNFVNENDMGIAMKEQGNPFAKVYNLYFGLSKKTMIFEPLHSIGLHVWILAIAAFVALFRKRKEWILAAPLLAMVLTLLVATPVSGEFRYAYGLFTAFPLVICACLYGKPEENW
jgi:hypothetical protein